MPPLGLISRTDERDDNDLSNNLHHSYLADAMGGHVGMILDDDGVDGKGFDLAEMMRRRIQ